MAFQRLCGMTDLLRGDMREFELQGHNILVVWPEPGDLGAFQAHCLHESLPLIDGFLVGNELTCGAHNWTFDAQTGENTMPGEGCLALYPLRVEDDDVLVDLEAMKPCRRGE
jgi:toluene monooxygenase system ferredoxin subunit